MSKGYVYILTNPAFQKDWIKIGKTSKTVEERVASLDCTSLPLPFNIYATVKTEHYNELEKLIHKSIDNLSDNRIRKNREYFKLPPEDALNFIRDLSDLYGDFEISVTDKDECSCEEDDIQENVEIDKDLENFLRELKKKYVEKFMNTDASEKWFSPLLYRNMLIHLSRKDIAIDKFTKEHCELGIDVIPKNGKCFIELFIKKKPFSGINPNVNHLKLIDIFKGFDFISTINQHEFVKRRNSICTVLKYDCIDEIANFIVKLSKYIEDNVDIITDAINKQFK